MLNYSYSLVKIVIKLIINRNEQMMIYQTQFFCYALFLNPSHGGSLEWALMSDRDPLNYPKVYFDDLAEPLKVEANKMKQNSCGKWYLFK